MKANILVVDDTRDNLRLLSNILTEQGYLVRPVSKGSKALSATKAKLPDLILLDIMMPDMDGYTVCEQLKADERTRDVPIIFISALNETFDKVKAFSCGGVDYVTKPFQGEEVIARVATHLALRKMQKSLEAEIAERKRAEEALREHNRELALLHHISQQLQACRTEQDTYQVLTETCEHLFPSSSGGLLRLDDGQTSLETVASWGSPPPEFQQLSAECLDLVYPDHIDIIEHPEVGTIASRIGYSPDSKSLCIPISSSETLLAVLTFSFETEEEWSQRMEAKQMILTEMVAHYALTLVNLRLRETLRLESIRDPLTELYNRRHMEEALVREIRRARRYDTPVSILMLDVDHFKTFNDTYGHEAGDVVLQELGALLQRNIRGGDIACRYGGEEFLLILPDTPLGIATQRAEQILKQIRTLTIAYQDTSFHITTSIGVSALPSHGHEVQHLIHAADEALYQAKNNGRNQVVVAPIV